MRYLNFMSPFPSAPKSLPLAMVLNNLGMFKMLKLEMKERNTILKNLPIEKTLNMYLSKLLKRLFLLYFDYFLMHLYKIYHFI